MSENIERQQVPLAATRKKACSAINHSGHLLVILISGSLNHAMTEKKK
jgi:hypothetical protein